MEYSSLHIMQASIIPIQLDQIKELNTNESNFKFTLKRIEWKYCWIKLEWIQSNIKEQMETNPNKNNATKLIT